MRFWLREFAGWGLVGIGLAVFVIVYALFTNEHRTPMYVEGVTMAVIGVFIFRGGINLLKTAVAARVCEQAQEHLYPATVPPVRPTPAQRPVVPASQPRTFG
jgi:hypothetical protein